MGGREYTPKTMHNTLRAWTTPLTIGCFICLAVTGFALPHLHGDIARLRTTHGWIGFAFFLAAIGHTIANKNGLKVHFRSRWGWVLVIGSTCLAILTVIAMSS